jgi:hypothetical protein
MHNRLQRLALVLSFALLLSLALAAGIAAAAPRAPGSPIWYVDDDTCPSSGAGATGDPFCRIQDAVDTATSGEEVRVAAGLYTGTHQMLASDGYTHTQVVFIDKDLTLLGGFDPADWSVSDPLRNLTTIDAQRAGRGITMLGPFDIWVTINGLTVTGGDYNGLGNSGNEPNQVCKENGADCGGGIYGRSAALTLRNCVISGNTGGAVGSEGGGVYLWEPPNGAPTLIENTRFISNSVAAHKGGGIFTDLTTGPVTVTDCLFQENRAPLGAGAVFHNVRAPLTIVDSAFVSNHAEWEGGAAWIRPTASGAKVLVERVTFLDNTGGTIPTLRISAAGASTPTVRILNSLFARNRVVTPTVDGAVLGLVANFTSVDVQIIHVTAAGNEAPSFLFGRTATSAGKWLSVSLTNTLLVSFTNAFALEEYVSGEARLVHIGTMRDNVAQLHLTVAGSPEFEAFKSLTGEAQLDADYRLLSSSDAIKMGQPTAATSDIDRQPRPINLPDIGADEWQLAVFVPLTLRQA